MSSPYSRILQALKQFEEQHLDDNAVPVFKPSPVDVRSIVQQNTGLLNLLTLALPYVEEGEKFNKPSGKKLSYTIRTLLQAEGVA